MGGSRSSRRSILLAVLSLLLSLVPVSFSQDCKSQKFTTKKTFKNCMNLPSLGAVLHWSMDEGTSTLSMAFTAKSDGGWVAWGLNPYRSGMIGTEALLAGKFQGESSVTVDTYDIRSYAGIAKGPLTSYKVTGISSEESRDGKITIFGDWVIPKGQSTVNQTWQVGPILGVRPGPHATAQPNLNSWMKLSLAGAPTTGSPAQSPARSPAESPKHEPEATTGTPVAAPAPDSATPPSPSGSIKPEVFVAPQPPTATPTAAAGNALLSNTTTGFGLGLLALILCFLL